MPLAMACGTDAQEVWSGEFVPPFYWYGGWPSASKPAVRGDGNLAPKSKAKGFFGASDPHGAGLALESNLVHV